jgi:hypothetical protein
LLAVAAVLIGVGSALGMAGLAVAAAALATACRRWYSRADLTPGELARLKWGSGQGGCRSRQRSLAGDRTGQALLTWWARDVTPRM